MNNSINNKILYLSYLLYILIPISLISGPFIPDLFLVLISIIFLFLIQKKEVFALLNNKYFFLFSIFCFIIIIISIFSNNLSSFKSAIFYFRFGLFAVATYILIKSNNQIFKSLFYLLLIVYSLLFIDTLYQYYFSKNLLGFTYVNSHNFRITSFFKDDEVLGSYTARFFPLLLFLLTVNTDLESFKKKITLISIIIIESFTIVLFSGERTSLALYILSFCFIFFSSKKIRKILYIPIISIFLISIITFSYSDKIKNRVITSTINQLGLSSKSERIVLFSKTYEGHYIVAANMFKEKPFFGHGPKMFRFFCNKDENFVAPNACSTHPHNFYAQMFSELGIFGFLSMFSIFLFICFLFVKNFFLQIFQKKQFLSDGAICLLAFYFCTFFPLLPSGNFFNNWLSIIIYYPLGFLIYLIKQNKFYA